MLRKIPAVLVLLCLVISSKRLSAQDYKMEAQNMFNLLNPINDALGPLIDQANGDFRDRLEQLRGIIGEALTNLNTIIKDSTIRLNADGEARLNQLNSHISSNLGLLNGIASGRIKQLDKSAEDRIEQTEIAADQLAESLPIDMQPLPKSPRHGFALVKPTNKDYALLYISGAGLRKGGTMPKAYFLRGDKTDFNLLSHNGFPLTVMAASMGLIQIKIPKDLFPAQGQSDKSITLTLATHNHLPGSVDSSFPLLLCSTPPKYTASVNIEASGYYWQTRGPVDYPSYTDKNQKKYYIDDNGSNNHKDLCASDADTDGWVGDPTKNDPHTLYGLHYDGASESRGAIVPNYPRNGCLHLYAGKDSGGGGNAQAWGITVFQRKLTAGVCGNGDLEPRTLQLGENSIDAAPSTYESSCISANEGAPSSAKARTRLKIKDDAGSPIETQDLVSNDPNGQSFFSDSINVFLNENGLIRLKVQANCRQDDINYASQ